MPTTLVGFQVPVGVSSTSARWSPTTFAHALPTAATKLVALASGLPETSVNRLREHPKNAKVLALAHERGIHASNDGGATWYSLSGTNMPTVSVDDAVFQERDNALVVGTHGRGIWVLDDVGPVETLTTAVASFVSFVMDKDASVEGPVCSK